MNRLLALLMVLAMVTAGTSLAGCASGEAPQNTASAGTAAAPATSTSTPAPTVSIPTATPGRATLTATATKARPSATPTRTPSPTPLPSPTPHLYAVQQFDTLLGIATQFGITVEELVTANHISTSDLLQIDQELIIPPPTATPTAVATSTTAVTSTTTSSSNLSGEQALPPPTLAPSGPPLPTVVHPPNVNPLTGLTVDDPAKLQRRPILVRVGNDVGARPQVGLNSADVVYEEITEWWVTRFTAIFLAESPTTVAPIRSARLVNVQLAPQYQGALAHSGGSDPVRWEISQTPLVNLDEYFSPKPYFYRPNEGWQTRLAIDVEAARNYMVSKGTEAPVALQGFLFSDTISDGEPGESIYIPYPRATSFTEWHYDAASGKYLRWTSGSPLFDFNGGQIAASNVIIYFAEHLDTDIVEDANGATSIRILLNGRGPAWFFRDGKLNKGFWQTDGTRTPYFSYEDDRSYSLKPGNTWVEVVPTYFTIGLNSADEASSKR